MQESETVWTYNQHKILDTWQDHIAKMETAYGGHVKGSQLTAIACAIISTMGSSALTNLPKNYKRIAKMAHDMNEAIHEESKKRLVECCKDGV